MVIKPDAPEHKELIERDIPSAAALQPNLTGGVVGVNRRLQRAYLIYSDVRRHLHRTAVDRYAEIDDPRILIVSDRLRL